MSDREAILTRIRDALQTPAPRPGVHDHPPLTTARQAAAMARQHLPPVGETHTGRLALFAKNSDELRTQFHTVPNESAAHTLLTNLAIAENWQHLATHPAILTTPAAAALAAATNTSILTVTEGCDIHALERCDAGLTECDALIAQTGSVLLSARSGGGRALSVLPPHHIVIARRAQLLPDLPSAYTLLHEKYGPADWPSMITLITGPSRTGDIERILILGAHGPKKLTVILLDSEA